MKVVVASVLAASALITVTATASAEDAPSFQNGFAKLYVKIGERMGTPTENEHPGDFLDSIVQMTTEGIAYFQSGHLPSFYDGRKRWAIKDAEVISWDGDELDPPEGQRFASVAATVSYRPVWDRLVGCEATGNWSINTGNGYYGGLQMDMTFWRKYGGLLYAARPDLASKLAQIEVAERGLAVQGWSAWPRCSIRLGLR